MQIFLEHFKNVTISLYWLQKTYFIIPKTCKMFFLMKYMQLELEKTCVKLFRNIKDGDTNHENPYFGQFDGGTWKQWKLYKSC